MKDKKKIAFLLSGFSQKIPSGKVNIDIIKQLSNDFEITVYGIECDEDLNSYVKFRKLNLIFAKPLLLRYFLLHVTYCFLFIIQKKYWDFDVIISVEPYSPVADIVQLHFCNSTAIDLINTGTLKYPGFRHPYYKLIYSFGAFCEKKILANHKLKAVVTVSEGLANEIRKCYSPKKDVITISNYLSVPHGSFTMVRREIPVSVDPFLGITVAHGDWERKGVRFIIDAVKILKQAGHNIKILIVGGGPLESYASVVKQKGLDNHITFFGPSTKIPDLLALANFFILPTAYEAMSLAVLEAAASGLPLLETDVNGVVEVLEDGKNGFFIKRDAEDIADKILKLKTSPAISLQAKAVEKNKVADLTLTRVVKHYRHLINQIIDEKKNTRSHTSQ